MGLSIAEVAERYELTADTLRYYERIGLIPRVNRSESGNRDYTDEDCRWVEFIKCMRSAGLPIEALIEYVELFQRGDATLSARKDLLAEQRTQLAEKVEEMQKVLARLDDKIERYETTIGKRERSLKRNQNNHQ